jgi:L-arabinokinase
MSTEDLLKGGQPIKIEHISGPEIKPHEILEFESMLRFQDERLFGESGFEKSGRVVITRAPARLDVMGGIADYCGAHVAALTLEHGAVVGCQVREGGQLRALSLGVDNHALLGLQISVDDFYDRGQLKSYNQIRQLFARNPKTAWAAYVLGGFYVLLKEGRIKRFPHGATLAIKSSIPIRAGIASSAAIEVAALTAANVVYELEMDAKEIARVGQIVESRVVGMPCGPMDQITSASGERGTILSIHCQSDPVLGTVSLPFRTRVIGIHSKVKRPSNAAYIDARTAAFMGLTILQRELDIETLRDNYLCNLTVQEFRQKYRSYLPARMKGQHFLNRYGGTVDSATEVNPEKTYHVRSRVEHPIYEHARVGKFFRCIKDAAADTDHVKTHLANAGRLMYASHWSYRYRVGLGSPQVEQIVNSIRKIGIPGGFYGARITSGGGGGTVAVLCHGNISSGLIQILAAYKLAWGLEAEVFYGTALGACQSEHTVLQLSKA